MVDITGLYFVIADGSQARFVRPGPDSRLHTIRIVSYDVMIEHVGEPTDTPKFERGTPRPEESKYVEFARRLAERINDDFAVDLFRYLVLVAPPEVLRELIAMVDGPTRASLIGSLARDLVTVPDPELWQHLDEWVSPALCA